MGIARVIICSVAAVATWFLAFAVAARIPGTPFHEVFPVIDRLADPGTGPAAFQEFLVIGNRTRWIAAVLFSVLAAGSVVLLSRWRVPLRRVEAAAIAVLFAMFMAALGAGLGPTEIVAAGLFATVTLLGTKAPAEAQVA